MNLDWLRRPDVGVRVLRRWFQARERFHDWMWSGGDGASLARRLARRLPYYFSDPYWMTDEQIDRAFAKGSPVVIAGSPWVQIQTPSTWSANTTTVWVANTTWPDKEKP